MPIPPQDGSKAIYVSNYLGLVSNVSTIKARLKIHLWWHDDKLVLWRWFYFGKNSRLNKISKFFFEPPLLGQFSCHLPLPSVGQSLFVVAVFLFLPKWDWNISIGNQFRIKVLAICGKSSWIPINKYTEPGRRCVILWCPLITSFFI